MTKRFLAVVLLAVLISGMGGCKRWVEIQDGQLSDEMLPYAPQVLGEYSGDFSKRDMTLDLRLNGRKLELLPDGDLAGIGCESRIGDLLSVAVDKFKGDVHVAEAIFAFSPGKCSVAVEGREVFVTFDKLDPGKMEISLLQRTVRELVCSDPAHFGRCVYRTKSYYLDGAFRSGLPEEKQGEGRPASTLLPAFAAAQANESAE